MYNNVWIRGAEQRYGTDPSNRYGKGGMERVMVPDPGSGPYNLTCTHMAWSAAGVWTPLRRPPSSPYICLGGSMASAIASWRMSTASWWSTLAGTLWDTVELPPLQSDPWEKPCLCLAATFLASLWSSFWNCFSFVILLLELLLFWVRWTFPWWSWWLVPWQAALALQEIPHGSGSKDECKQLKSKMKHAFQERNFKTMDSLMVQLYQMICQEQTWNRKAVSSKLTLVSYPSWLTILWLWCNNAASRPVSWQSWHAKIDPIHGSWSEDAKP